MFDFFPIFDFFGVGGAEKSTALVPVVANPLEHNPHPRRELQWPSAIPNQGIHQSEMVRFERHNTDGTKDIVTTVRSQTAWRN